MCCCRLISTMPSTLLKSIFNNTFPSTRQVVTQWSVAGTLAQQQHLIIWQCSLRFGHTLLSAEGPQRGNHPWRSFTVLHHRGGSHATNCCSNRGNISIVGGDVNYVTGGLEEEEDTAWGRKEDRSRHQHLHGHASWSPSTARILLESSRPSLQASHQHITKFISELVAWKVRVSRMCWPPSCKNCDDCNIIFMRGWFLSLKSIILAAHL